MLSAYFNYPNSAVTVHAEAACQSVRQQRKVAQRIVHIDRTSLSSELQRFKIREFKFASTAALNDLWLQVDLSDSDLELAIVRHVHRQLSKTYKRFANAEVRQHC